MPFRARHNSDQDRTGLPWVMAADKRRGQKSLKHWRKAKCLINCDRISLEIFRKKKKTDCKDGSLSTRTAQPFISQGTEKYQVSLWSGGFCDRKEQGATWAWLMWMDSTHSVVSPTPHGRSHHFCFAEKLSCLYKVPQGWDSNPGLPTTNPDHMSPCHLDSLVSTLY